MNLLPRHSIRRRAFLGALLLTSTIAALAGSTPLTTVRVANGLSLPCFVTFAPGDYSRLFIIEQRSGTTGRIRILDLTTNTLLATPFLSVSPVSTGDEQGLLGLAFHPNYATNGYFWVNYTDAAGTTNIVRYQASPPSSNVANPASATTVLTISQPFNNHNGGWMGFGPDGYLYDAQGDGGNGNDPGNRAQDITSQLLGKMLRIDVDGPNNIPGDADDDGFPADATRLYTIPSDNPFVGISGDDEIWAYGLRNPWRPSFDRATGDFWIADVGQDAVEEINFQPAGPVASVRGRNYGWRCMEGTSCTGLSGCTCNAAGLTLPIHTYTHSIGCSITGGYVYRGCAMPAMQGNYFFADYCQATIWSFQYTPSAGMTNFQDRTAELAPGGGLSIGLVTSFGEDAYGEIYICDRGGEVFKIVPQSIAAADCNNNGVADACEIQAGLVADCNHDGIPDSCAAPNPTISQQPLNASGCVGASAQFTVAVNGTAPISYQWRKGVTPIGGATSATLTINPVTAGSAGSYNCVITDACGGVTSNSGTLFVLTAPSIVDPPANATACVGSPFSLSVFADGSPTLSYQWYHGNTLIPGATGDSYDVASATVGDGGTYHVRVTNTCGVINSTDATVTVSSGPSISQQPAGGLVCDGDGITLTVTASGATSYQWRKGGTPIGGATNASYTINPAHYSATGSYDVVVTGPCGSVPSNSAQVRVFLVSDANCDGAVNNFDIDYFVVGVLNAGVVTPPPAYLAQGGTAECWSMATCWGDANPDGAFNNFDIDGFVNCVLSAPPPGTSCP